MFSSTAEALHGAAWIPWRSGYRGEYELRNGGELVATLRMVHLRWRRRAQGEFLGRPWVLEETHGHGFVFRESWASSRTKAQYRVPDLHTIVDADGPVYRELPDGAFVDGDGNVLLQGRAADSWKDDAVPVMRLGESAAANPRLHLLVLLREYVWLNIDDWTGGPV